MLWCWRWYVLPDHWLESMYSWIINHVWQGEHLLIDLNPDDRHYYWSIVSMNRFDESCNARFQDPFGRICVPDKMEEVKLEVSNMKRINKRETLTKRILCECRYGLCYVSVDLDMLVENVIQDKNWTLISVTVSVKSQYNIEYVKNSMHRILVHVLVNMIRIVTSVTISKNVNVWIVLLMI